MIDVLIKLLEKLIELAKHRKEVEEKPFDLLISPLYSNLEKIHPDYLRLFESCQSELKSGVQLEVVVKHLMVDRLEQEALRSSIIAFADSYSLDPRLKPYEYFFKEVVNYFYGFKIVKSFSGSTHLLLEIDCWLREERKRDTFTEEDMREGFIRLTQTILSNTRKSWKEISKEYAKLSAKRATG